MWAKVALAWSASANNLLKSHGECSSKQFETETSSSNVSEDENSTSSCGKEEEQQLESNVDSELEESKCDQEESKTGRRDEEKGNEILKRKTRLSV